MLYGLRLVFSDIETHEIQLVANDLEEAERFFIANIDSGDYDDIIQDREFTCEDVFALV